MRMRKKKNGSERLAACSDYLLTSREMLAQLPHPIHLEIGCGKGAFVIGMAKKYPSVTFIAMEKVHDVLMLAAERVMAEGLQNVRLLRGDAAMLADYFSPGDIDRIYLNFSDPWPKARHAKRRLTAPAFLDSYRTLLGVGGKVCFKTDNEPLFTYSLETFPACGYTLSDVTHDLHNSPYMAENVVTEYEKNFSEKGFSIHRLVATVTELPQQPTAPALSHPPQGGM